MAEKGCLCDRALVPGNTITRTPVKCLCIRKCIFPPFNVAMSGIELGSTYVPKQCQIPVNYCDLELRSQMLQHY
jgi:hypothetical protein